MSIILQVLLWWAIGGLVIAGLLHLAHKLGTSGIWNDKDVYEE